MKRIDWNRVYTLVVVSKKVLKYQDIENDVFR